MLDPLNQEELSQVLKLNDYISQTFRPIENNLLALQCISCSASQKRKYEIAIQNLSKHLQSKTHEKHNHDPDIIATALAFIDKINIQPRYSQFSNSQVELPSPKIIRNNKYQFRFEVTSFLIQNNLPFDLSDKLSAFISTLVQKFTSDELSIFTVDRNHISDIAGSCLGPFFQQSYLNLLKNTPFSLSLDEGSIKGNTEYLAVNARYLETSTSLHTTTKLIAMIQLEGSKTGETLYNLLVSLLFTGSDGEMRKKMCLGNCTDGAANMISSGNSFLTSRLE